MQGPGRSLHPFYRFPYIVGLANNLKFQLYATWTWVPLAMTEGVEPPTTSHCIKSRSPKLTRALLLMSMCEPQLTPVIHPVEYGGKTGSRLATELALLPRCQILLNSHLFIEERATAIDVVVLLSLRIVHAAELVGMPALSVRST